MNKGELIDRISFEMGTSKVSSEKFLETFTSLVTAAIHSGEDVRLVGFGTFTKGKRKARMGRNPQTGASIKIPAMWVPKFKAGTAFKEMLR